MYQCKSGRHWWLHMEDAARCCNGYKRILVIAPPGERLPAEARPVDCVPGIPTGWQWASEKELQEQAG